MKAKVIKTYIDRTTRIKHMRGEIVQVDEERFEEINSTAHGVFLKEKIDSDINTVVLDEEASLESPNVGNTEILETSKDAEIESNSIQKDFEEDKKELDTVQNDQSEVSNKKKNNK